LAIELSLNFGMELKQLLRKTQELMRSITGLLGAEIAAPHFTTLSCRGIGLDLPPKAVPKSVVPVHWSWIALDQKYSVKGEWLEQKLKLKRKRNSWRKLYFGHDLVSGHIVCANLPTNDIGNSTALPGLLDQIGGPVKLFHADGAFDGERNMLWPYRTLPLVNQGHDHNTQEGCFEPRCRAEPERLGHRHNAYIAAHVRMA
jgi:hypothetical protein